MNKYCGNCGNMINEDAAFCPHCGTAVNNQWNENINQSNGGNRTNNYGQQGVANNITNNYATQNMGNNFSNTSVNPNNGSNVLKVISLIFGIIGIIGSFIFNVGIIPFAIAGLVLGIIYKSKTKKMCAGIILNIIGIVMPIVIIIFCLIILGLNFTILEDEVEDMWNEEYNQYENIYDYDYDYDYDFGDNIDGDNGVVEEVLQRVGNDEYGYINVPDNWGKFYDLSGNDTLQYSYANVWILSLYAVDNAAIDAEQYAKNLENALYDAQVQQINVQQVKVANYDAYQVSGYYYSDNIWLVMWTFEDENGKLHYISIEGPDKDSEYFNLVDSFAIDE